MLTRGLIASKEFNLDPKPPDPLYWDLQYILSKPDASVANQSAAINVLDAFFREHSDSVTWFPAAGVSYAYFL
jgi:hypothetical protein